MEPRVREFNPLDAWSKAQMVFGGLLILMGIAIIAMPEILVAMVAAVIFMAGAGLIASGWRARRMARRTIRDGEVHVVEW